jgi:hypothetical protein
MAFAAISGQALDAHVIGHDQDDVGFVRRCYGKTRDDGDENLDEFQSAGRMICRTLTSQFKVARASSKISATPQSSDGEVDVYYVINKWAPRHQSSQLSRSYPTPVRNGARRKGAAINWHLNSLVTNSEFPKVFGIVVFCRIPDQLKP